MANPPPERPTVIDPSTGGVDQEILLLRHTGLPPDHYHSQAPECGPCLFFHPDSRLISVRTVQGWQRLGAECYVIKVSVQLNAPSGTAKSLHIVGKAYVGFGLGLDPAHRIRIWGQRLVDLNNAGVPVPCIYGLSGGVLLQECIPDALTESVEQDRVAPDIIAAQLLDLAQRFDGLGVRPTCILRDLRCRGSRVYVVDVGEDLGEIPGVPTVGGNALSLLLSETHSVMPSVHKILLDISEVSK